MEIIARKRQKSGYQRILAKGKLKIESINAMKDHVEKQKKQKKTKVINSLQKKPSEMEFKKQEIPMIEMRRPKLIRIQVHPQLTY